MKGTAMSSRHHRVFSAAMVALIVLMFSASIALAHAVDDPSPTHRIIDSALIPLLGLGMIAVVSLIMWHRNRHQA
jgi:hypothetical protein